MFYVLFLVFLLFFYSWSIFACWLRVLETYKKKTLKKTPLLFYFDLILILKYFLHFLKYYKNALKCVGKIES